jgi:hypothetical protein
MEEIWLSQFHPLSWILNKFAPFPLGHHFCHYRLIKDKYRKRIENTALDNRDTVVTVAKLS